MDYAAKSDILPQLIVVLITAKPKWAYRDVHFAGMSIIELICVHSRTAYSPQTLGRSDTEFRLPREWSYWSLVSADRWVLLDWISDNRHPWLGDMYEM
jgi:hypothetical protein